MRKWGIILICFALVAVVLGVQLNSFNNIERAVEEIDDSSDTLLQDLSSLSLFAFTASDFFQGARYYELRLLAYQDGDGNLTGEAKIVYHSYRYVYVESIDETLLETVREEELPLYPKGSGMTLEQMEAAFDRVTYPIKPFTQFDEVEYNGIFGVVLTALQYIAYILSMIYAVICIVVLIAIDTIGVAWGLLNAALKIVGLA